MSQRVAKVESLIQQVVATALIQKLDRDAAGVTVTNTESVVFEWLRDARHVHFKSLSALLR